jgi:hypothetical protein
MDDFSADQLTIKHQPAVADALALQWVGKSNARDPVTVLRPFFTKVLEQAASRQLRVEMHFEKLEYLNSSTIAALIQLINAAQAKGVRLVLYYDAKQRWQTLSFDGLKRAIQAFTLQQGAVEFIGR